MRSRLLCLSASLVLSLGIPSLAHAEDLVLGMSAAFSGPSRGLGIELYRGAQACFQDMNEAGGIHGRKIVIKAYDDGYNPVPAIENTVRLIEQDNVFLLFGYVGTPTVTRTLPLLKRYQDRSVLLFCPFTGAEPQRQPPYDGFVFNLRASYAEETAGLVEQFIRVGRKRIAVFYQIDAYGRSGWEGVRKALAGHHLTITAEATYRRGTPFEQSMRPQVDILRRAEPEAVICVGSYAACAAFVRDARDAGWDVPIANVSFVGSENLLRLLTQGDRDYTRNLLNSQVVPSYFRTELPAVRDYRRLMEKLDPKLPAELGAGDYQVMPYSYVSLEGYLDARLLVEVLKRMGPEMKKSDLRRVAEALEHIDLGIEEPAGFSPRKHQALDRVYFTEVENGRFVPVKSWEKYSR